MKALILNKFKFNQLYQDYLLKIKTDINYGLVLDTRSFQKVLIEGLLPNSINISLIETPLKDWVPLVINPNSRLLVVSEDKLEEECYTSLNAIGYSKIDGLSTTFITDSKEFDIKLNYIKNIELDVENTNQYTNIIDCRENKEHLSGVVEKSHLMPLSKLNSSLETQSLLPSKDGEIFVYCRTGKRSMIASSLLLRHGFTNINNINGGITRLISKGIKLIRI